MGSRTDDKFAALRGQSYTGAMSDMVLQWLQDNGATSDAIPDAWCEMLTAQGFPCPDPRHRNGAWFDLLAANGYDVGAYPDREAAFWASGSPFFSTIFAADLQAGLSPRLATGSDVATFTRTTTRTLVDFEGVVRTTKNSEPGFMGARRVENMQPTSDEPLTGAIPAFGGQVLSTTSFKTTPGGPSGQIAFLVINKPAMHSIDDKGRPFTISATISCDVEDEIITFAYLEDGLAGPAGSVAPTSTPVRYTIGAGLALNGDSPDGSVTSVIIANTSEEAVFTVTDFQFEWVDGQTDQSPAPYISSASEYGANVNGVKYYPNKNSGAAIGSNDYYADAQGPYGYVVEPQTTNPIWYSNDLASWAFLNSELGALETVSFNGKPSTINQLKSLNTGGSGTIRINTATYAITAGVNTVSMYAKAGSLNGFRLLVAGIAAASPAPAVSFRVDEGNVTTHTGQGGAFFIRAGTQELGNGWVRCWMTFDSQADTTIFLQALAALDGGGTTIPVLDGTQYIFCGGIMVNPGQYPASYIETGAAAATKNRDILYYDDAGNIEFAEGQAIADSHTFWPSTAVTPDNRTVLGKGISFLTYILNGRTSDSLVLRTSDTLCNVIDSGDFMDGDPVKVSGSWSATGAFAKMPSKTGPTQTYSGALQSGDIYIGCQSNGDSLGGTVRRVNIRDKEDNS